MDKIRSEYASNTNSDRCISVLNPMKFEMKATESFRCMLQRIRYLMLVGYNRNIAKYEGLIRTHRERRNQDSWNFIDYFLIQEQLASVLQMLGPHLYTEALVQYDELDAMLSQFVLNSVIAEKPRWMKVFENTSQSFEGVNLEKKVLAETRKKIVSQSISLLQFRSYIFARQSILLRHDKPWAIAKRLLPFLFSTIREIDTLKVDMPKGALSCWQFICAMEVLKICEAADTGESDECFQYTADIWNLAKDKLYELGKLCGLLPGCTPSSEQLHIVVQLSAGIGDTITVDDLEALVSRPYSLVTGGGSECGSRSPSPARVKKPPTERLKAALGSSQAFETLYKELCELAISTYKHISRHRSARLVGLDLGSFYCALNEPQQAIVFFNDQMRELKAEQWNFLASQSLLELASCYKKMGNLPNYTKTCGTISCCVELEILVRYYYFEEYLKSLKQLKDKEAVLVPFECPLEDHFKVQSVRVLSDGVIIHDHDIELELVLESHFPREIHVDQVQLSYVAADPQKTEDTELVVETKNSLGSKLPLKLNLEYKQDHTLDCSALVLESKKQPVRRTSSTKRKVMVISRGNFENFVQCTSTVIKPGMNSILLRTKATRVGNWSLSQLSIVFENMDFLSETLPRGVTFQVESKSASATLVFDQLYAGLEQGVQLKVSAGSFMFPHQAAITLKGSDKLRFMTGDGEFLKDLSVDILDMKQFEERIVDIKCICDLPGRREDKPIEHFVELCVPWTRTNISIPLSFSPALTATCRLHTAGIKKFLQVIVKGMMDERIILSAAKMKCKAEGIEIMDLNPKSQTETTIYKDLTVSYLFEIQIEPLKTENESPVIQINFMVQYAPASQPEFIRPYSCKFDVTDYATYYRIQAKIEPSELCRVSSVCTLSLRISKVLDNPHKELMYEVLADQNMWAVCGRSSGVVSMADVQHQTITVEVLPLSAGFLALPTIRILKYQGGRSDTTAAPKLLQFPPGQIYNATKSMQIHVLSSN